MKMRHRALLAAPVAVVGAAATGVGLRLAIPPVAELVHALSTGGPSVSTLVGGGCGVVVLAGVLWGAVTATGFVLVVVARSLHPESALLERLHRFTERATPSLVRVVLATSLGTGVAVAPQLAVGALAMAADDEPHGTVRPDLLSGLAIPSRVSGAPVVAAAIHPQARPGTTPSGPRRVVTVHRGDSLWSVAQELVGSRNDRLTTRTWRAIYRTNHARIGPDPDLVRPGQRLHLPTRLVHPTPDREDLP